MPDLGELAVEARYSGFRKHCVQVHGLKEDDPADSQVDVIQRTATRLQPAKAKEGIGIRVAEGHMAIPTAARQLPSAQRTSESITHVEGTPKPPTRTD